VSYLFETLTQAVGSTTLVAIAASFTWGVLSVLLSPCHLASIPLIVAFVNGQGQMTTRRAFFVSALFALGIMITIAALGTITAAVGRVMGDIGSFGSYFVAAIFFLVGLNLMDIIPMPWSAPGEVGMKTKGLLASFFLGIVFGIALGPCTFAFMAPMLAVTFKIATTELLYGILLLLVFGVGHCAVIISAGTSTKLAQQYLNWNERSRGTLVLKKICGVLILIAGVYLIYTVT